MVKNSSAREVMFEMVLEGYLLNRGYASVACDGFDWDRAIFPDTALAFSRETRPTAAVTVPIDVGAAV